LPKVATSTSLLGFLHAVNLRHGTDGFTSPPKEGALRNFSPEKSDSFGRVWTQRPARWPLDHRSYVHHQEDHIVHAVLYGMFFMLKLQQKII